MSNKWVYTFNEGNKDMIDLLGGKGAGLAEMSNLKIPVPFGITVTTKACSDFYNNNQKLSEEITNQIFDNIKIMEKETNKKFGGADNPLLVSVRSGAAISMPGMMDTVLNLGINDTTIKGLARRTANSRFAYDCYRRFIQMFSDVVLSIPKYKFDYALEDLKDKYKYKNDTELTKDNLIELIQTFKNIYKKETLEEFPEDPYTQLLMAVEAVFKSWNNSRAKVYRDIYNIDDNMGTAVTIQSMVYGNMSSTSGTGVAFSRNPSTGEKYLFGEYLLNAQGEDVVAGIRTPLQLYKLEEMMPDVYNEFIDISNTLEERYKDMQDMEFTIEQGKLYILQTRIGKRTTEASLRIAVDMVEEGLITKKEAIMRITPDSLNQLLHPTFDSNTLKEATPIAKGLPASPGAVTGRVYFNAEDAVKATSNGEKVILVRKETSAEDISGITKAEGILTSRGGMTSHAAVVARGMGKCCVAGCDDAYVDEELKILMINDEKIEEGSYISLDGSLGFVYRGIIKTVEPSISGNFKTLMSWADKIKNLSVRTNADTPQDIKTAFAFGADGIGLCRTEHMFFEQSRILLVRKMILAETYNERKQALETLIPMQKDDFKEIYQLAEEKPVTIRLLDPPLYEFLPHTEEEIKKLAEDMNMNYYLLKEKINSLSEFNPTLGHRGCRLLISYNEIASMQIKAIITAAIEVSKEKSINVKPEIMIPLVGDTNEFKYLNEMIAETASDIMKQMNFDIKYSVGALIEIPRACILSDEIAQYADFFSYGTNDLTQMTYGFSRDDSGKFIADYKDLKIFDTDPFETIDTKGIGHLIKMSIKLGKSTNKDIKTGVCGEHAGDAKSIKYFNDIGIDYVSCSPYKIPIARLSAAQAVIN